MEAMVAMAAIRDNLMVPELGIEVMEVMPDYRQVIPDKDMVTVPTPMVQELGTTVYPGYPSPLPQQPPLRLPPQ